MAYFDFDTTTTTTRPPEVERYMDKVESDPEQFNSSQSGMPNELKDTAHPVSMAKEDIDPKPHGKNTTPYQQVQHIMQLLERFGVPTVWERAFPCPCFDPNTQQPKADCPLCHGKGILYKDPKVLQVAYQSNSKNPYNGSMGNEDIGTTIGTPQLTENGIENGISFRDRLTITGLTIAQTFMFNVNDFREFNGMFIPYLVTKFNNVYTLKDGVLIDLVECTNAEFVGKNQYFFDSKTNRMFVSPDLKGNNVTMSITSPLRYYVVDIAKETRYAQVVKQQDKEAIFNYGDPKLTNYFQKYSEYVQNGTVYIRMPKKLILRREDMYIPRADIIEKDSKGNTTVVDPKASIEDEKNISDFFGNN